MQTKDEWILENHLGLQIIRCPKCNQAINCNQYGLYYKEHYRFCPFCGEPMKVPESPITHMPSIPPTEETLTDDERWNRKLETMKRVVQIWKKRRVEMEIKKMVVGFFCDNYILGEEKGVCSDNQEWHMTSGNGNVVGEIYYCKKSACQIKDTSYGYAVVPACDEMYYVAEYTADALRDFDFEVKIFDRYYDEPGDNEI